MDSMFSLLFNQFSERDVSTFCNNLNKKIDRKELKYSERQVLELLKEREKALSDNHLLDFSLDMQEILIPMLSQSEYVSIEDFFQLMLDFQELFYFLRSNLQSEFDDDSLIEKIVAVFNEKGGSLNSTQGFFENWLIERSLYNDQIIKKSDE